MLRSISWSALLALALLLPLTTSASDLKVGNAWLSLPILREAPPAYFAIQNRGKKPRKIVGASSPRCERIEIHRATVVEGAVSSEKLDEMEIPAGGAVAFAPRGLFLSLIGAESLEEDEVVPIELEFADGERVLIEAIARDD